MGDNFAWIAILGGGGGVGIIAFISFWMTLSSRITTSDNKAQTAEDRAKGADLLAATALAKYEIVNTELNAHKVQTAAKVATLEATMEATARSLIQAETRLVKSLEDMQKSMDHLSDTIIKTLGELIGRQSK